MEEMWSLQLLQNNWVVFWPACLLSILFSHTGPPPPYTYDCEMYPPSLHPPPYTPTQPRSANYSPPPPYPGYTRKWNPAALNMLPRPRFADTETAVQIRTPKQRAGVAIWVWPPKISTLKHKPNWQARALGSAFLYFCCSVVEDMAGK